LPRTGRAPRNSVALEQYGLGERDQ